MNPDCATGFGVASQARGTQSEWLIQRDMAARWQLLAFGEAMLRFAPAEGARPAL